MANVNILAVAQERLAKAKEAHAKDTEILAISTDKRAKSIKHLEEVIAAKKEDQARIDARFEKQLAAKAEKILEIELEIEAIRTGVNTEETKTPEQLAEEQVEAENIAEGEIAKSFVNLAD